VKTLKESNDIKAYEATPYTTTLDWESGKVWIIDHVNKRKFVLTEIESQRIARNFELIKAFK